MSVRQAGLPGDSPWYHVAPRSALPFAWAGNAGEGEGLELMAADGVGYTPLQFPLTSPPLSMMTSSSAVTLDVEEEPVVDSGATVVVRIRSLPSCYACPRVGVDGARKSRLQSSHTRCEGMRGFGAWEATLSPKSPPETSL